MVWTLALQPESEGPTLISCAVRLLSGGHIGLLSAPSWRTVVREAGVFDVGLLAAAGDLFGPLQHPVYLGEV